MTILKILKILNFYPFYLFYSEVEGKYLDLSHFHYNPAEFVLTWQIQTSSLRNLNFPDVIFIYRNHQKLILLDFFHEFSRIYAWEKSCLFLNRDLLLRWIFWILPENADFYHFWWFFNEFSAFCTWAMILLMNFVNFCILIRPKTFPPTRKKYLEIRLSCQRSNFNLRLSQFGKNL